MASPLRPIAAFFLSATVFLHTLPVGTSAEEDAQAVSGMECLTAQEGTADVSRLFDGNTLQPVTLPDSTELTFSDPHGFGSAYLIFDTEYGPYTVTDPETGQSHTFGEQGFLHAYLNLTEEFGYVPKVLAFSFPSGDAQINELTLFSPGQVPDTVQKWNAPKEGETDLMLFSAHGDDEQLFFAGLLPCYAGERGYEALVVYLTNHRNQGTRRCHEMLDGLWAVGVTTYPVFGDFGDYFCRSKEQALAIHARNGQSEEAMLRFVVEQLRRFHPQVVVGHDINGEYGHGQHMLFSSLLCQGIVASEDPQIYPDLTETFGAWQVPKAYLHLWEENPVTLDFDQPLARFDGLTAFQASMMLGFSCHKSQSGGVTGLITRYERAGDIPKFSPCQYGLYRSTVGPDTLGQDLFENLTSYRQQQVMAAFARNREDSLEACQTARTLAENRQHTKEQQEEAVLIQRRAEAMARREARRRRRICLAVFTAASVSGLTLLVLKRRKKK